MKLLIVESPSKAKTIEKYLGGEFTVRASVGHVRDLPKSNKNAIDIEHGFKPSYEVDPKKITVIKELKDLDKKATETYLATDPDREGEAIAWHLADELKLKNPKRITYYEITEKAVREALLHPRDIDMNLKYAQEARRVLDRLVGYDLSGIIWKKVRYGLSAGRVQSPALRIIVEREKEIRAFVPEKYFTITGNFETVGKIKESKKYKIELNCEEEPKTDDRATEIVEAGEKAKWKIESIKSTEAERAPYAPFTTSTLQQTASSRLGFAPSRTMSIAQKLYEKGHITYMRTDSTNIGVDAKAEIKNVVEKLYGATYHVERVYKSKSKNAQEAHEAVRPTHATLMNAGSTDEEKRLYKLIWERTVSSQMASAKVMRTKVIAKADDKKVPSFDTNGSVLIFDGWLAADPAGRGEDALLPKMEEGQDIKVLKISSEMKFTQPPNRYTEAGLVKELEKRGIGRPSTYASICKTIEDRGYVTKENKSLHATQTGEVVSDFLSAHFEKYISDDFTADMENKLDDIANGDATYVNTLTDFYGPFKEALDSKKDIDKATNIGVAPENILCPKCESHMVEKLSRNGSFYSCARYPDCDGARKIDGEIMAEPKTLGKKCPKCEKGELMEREGKFGLFVACSNYPKCKYIEQSEEQKKKNLTGVKCNKCADGEMEERRGRFGLFYSCSNYPNCKHIVKTKPTGNICSICQELMIEGTKTIPERCSNKSCPMHNPHKMTK